MRKILFFILITISFLSYGQRTINYTLDSFISSANGMEFKLTLSKTDSIVLSKGFNFERFIPTKFSLLNGFYKTYYINSKIALVEFYSDSINKKNEYKCYVNDFDSLKYFVFHRPINSDTLVAEHAIGVNISAENSSFIIATHRVFNTDTIIKTDSNFAINYPAAEQTRKETKYSNDTKYTVNWISDSYYCGCSIIIIDSNLLPLNRFYFNTDFLIYFTNCRFNNNICTEYVFSYNPRIDQFFKEKCLINTIDIKLIFRIKQFNTIWPTFIIKHSYPIKNYHYKWEFYKSFNGEE